MSGKLLWLVTFPWTEEGAKVLQEPFFGERRRAALRLYKSVDGQVGRAYVDTDDKPTALPAAARLARIAHTLDVPGASFGSAAPFHYVVSTDILPEAEADMNAWYDTEHLPGLAAVPGTVLAQRHVDIDPQGSPRYHASYDLATRAAFNSERWLAVRATAWSSRVRPAFRHTERIMFDRVA